MEQVKIGFPPSVWAEIKRQAKAQGISGAAYVRQTVLERLARDREHTPKR